MNTCEEMEDKDGYMMLNFKNHHKTKQRSKGRNIVSPHSDSSLKWLYSHRKTIIFEYILSVKINYSLGF